MLLLNPAWLLTLVLSSSPPNVTTLLCSQTLFTSKSLIATKSFLTTASERYTVREEKCYNQYRPYCFLYRMSDPITDPCSNNGSDTSIDGNTQSLSQHDIIARNNVYLGYRRVVPFFSFFFFFAPFVYALQSCQRENVKNLNWRITLAAHAPWCLRLLLPLHVRERRVVPVPGFCG